MPSESTEWVLLELTACHLRCMRGVLHKIQNVDICHQASCFSDFNLHTLLLAAQALLLSCHAQQFPIVGGSSDRETAVPCDDVKLLTLGAIQLCVKETCRAEKGLPAENLHELADVSAKDGLQNAEYI